MWAQFSRRETQNCAVVCWVVVMPRSLKPSILGILSQRVPLVAILFYFAMADLQVSIDIEARQTRS